MSGRPRAFDSQKVLESAMHAFWRRGFEATSVADLEAATGLGRQSLYGAFGDKRALFKQVVDFYHEHVLKPGIIDVLDAAGSGRANIERVLEQWAALASSSDFNGCLVGNASTDLGLHDAEMAEVLRGKLRALEDAFARALRRAVRDGELKQELDVRSTARHLLTIAQGLAVLARVQREPSFVRAVIDNARRLLD
jgi:TetR/AcrR family transcriptional repressor of nem operon